MSSVILLCFSKHFHLVTCVF